MKKIITIMLIMILALQGLFIAGCGKKEEPNANPSVTDENNSGQNEQVEVNDEDGGEQSSEPSGTDEQDGEQNEDPVEEQKPQNPYPDGIVRHNPEKDYLIETWGIYNDRFDRPDIEVPEEAIERLGEYAIEWPEFIDKVEWVEYDELNEGKTDRYFFRDDGFMKQLDYYKERYEKEKAKGTPELYNNYRVAYNYDLNKYNENPEKYEEKYGKYWYKYIETDNYDVVASWNIKSGYYLVKIYGKNWEVNSVKYNSDEYNKYKLYRGEGIIKFTIDDEAEDLLVYMLSNILKRNEVRLVMMKLKELEKAMNEAMDRLDTANVPIRDIDTLDDIQKVMLTSYQVMPYVYHMYFDTGMSVSFMMYAGRLAIDVCRWDNIDELKQHAKNYYTGANIANSHKVADAICKYLNLNITK